MELIQRLLESIRGRGMSVVLPEGSDPRIVSAARRLRDEELAQPILLGRPDQVDQGAQQAGVSLDGLRVIDPASGDLLEKYTQLYAERRDMEPKIAQRLVKRPLFFSSLMVSEGQADTMVAGVTYATANVIQAGVLALGYAPGSETASSFFLMVVPGEPGETSKTFLFADCAVNVDPTPNQLADIAIASAASAKRLLGEEPAVALLSFSTQGSAAHALVDKVQQAVAIAQQRDGLLLIDGEFQADTAIAEAVAQRKVKRASRVAGRANVLIFPDLNSGNIAYKLTQYLARAQAIGPFLQGFAKPISDLSRGASEDDIVATCAIALAQAAESDSP